MATVSLRMEDELRDRAEDAAAAAGVSISEWTRDLMRAELGMDVDGWSAPASMSKRDRRTLVMLHELAARLADDDYEVKQHERMIEVLESGYTLEYSEEFLAIEDEMSLEECRLVQSILDMFRFLGLSLDALDP